MKNNRLLLPLFFFFPFFSALAQDELHQKILSQKEDTARVNALLDQAKTFLYKDNAKALAIYKSAVALSKQLNYDLGMANGLLKVGVIYEKTGRYRESIDAYRQDIIYCEKIKKYNGVVMCQNNIGNNFEQLGRTDSAMYYYLAAIKNLDRLPDKKGLYSVLHENVGTLYANMLNYTKAIEYGTKALTFSRSINDTVHLVTALTGLSYSYCSDENYRQALDLAKEALVLAKTVNNNVFLANACHCLAGAYIGLKQYDDAIDAARQSMQFAAVSDFQLYVTSALHLADALEKKKAFAAEAKAMLELLAKCEEKKNVLYRDDIYERLATAYASLGKHKKAYQYQVKNELVKDSILNEKTNRAVAELEIKYQTAEKEKALSNQRLSLASKEVQLYKSRRTITYSIVAAIIGLSVAVILLMHAIYKRKMHTRQIQSLQKDKEIELLHALMQGEEKERSRIAKDLHDGVAGMLAAVKMHLSAGEEKVKQLKGYEKAVQLLNEATAEVRKTSHNLMPEILLQRGLNKALRRYCENISNASLQVQYYFVGEEQRYTEGFELSVYRVVQELLNNIFKHSKAAEAVVQMSIQNELLYISIEDNGIGFSPSAHAGGIGLEALKRRIAALNGSMELHAETGSGVCVYLEFYTGGFYDHRNPISMQLPG